VSSELYNLADLPEPVVRHLRYAGVADAVVPTVVRMRHTGDIRLRPDQRRSPHLALLRFTTDPPGFVREARVRTAPLVVLRAHDELSGGVARARVWPFRSYKSVDDTGYEVDQDAVVRFMSDTPWFPAVWRMPYISWEANGADSAVMSVTIGGTLAHAVVNIDSSGALINFEADRFHRLGGGEWQLATWVMRYGPADSLAGIRAPLSADATWRLADGDFPYIRFDVEDLSYDFRR